MPAVSEINVPVVVEFAKSYLDNIPAENEDEINCIAQALKTLLDPFFNYIPVSPSLKGRITVIREIIAHPEFYVEDNNDYEVFKKIFTEEIDYKISELESLDSSSKTLYINKQDELKEKILNNSIIQLTFKEWLLKLQLTSNVPKKSLNHLYCTYLIARLEVSFR